MAIKYLPGKFPQGLASLGQFSQTKACTVGTDVAGIGTSAWTNPGNITALDGNYAIAATTAQSHWLQATGFGFSIPAGATIVGVSAAYYKKGDGNESDAAVRLIKGGVVQATDRSAPGAWPNAVFTQGYGGASDLWGAALAPADVNAANFGVALSASVIAPGAAQVDYVTMTVYYQPFVGNQPSLYDDVTLPTPFASSYSSGAMLLINHPEQPSGSQKWKLIAVSFHSFLALHATNPLYGKFGQLFGAAIIDPVGAISPAAAASFGPMPSSDRSLAETIWDPATNPLPPLFTGASGSPVEFTGLLHCDAIVTPPQIREVLPGGQIAIGLWLTPSLLGSPNANTIGGLYVFDAKYSLVIDDGT